MEKTEALVFSADETLDIGNETGSPVTKDYSTRKFSGEVNWVEIDVGDAAEDLDHLIKPEERLAIAMAVQVETSKESSNSTSATRLLTGPRF